MRRLASAVISTPTRLAPIYGLRCVCALLALLLTSQVALSQVPRADQWPNTDFSKTSISFDEILSGGPPKDGIPSIDEPTFVTQQVASDWLDAREPVAVVQIGDEVRAYPLQILMWHEIVNDTVGDVPVTVTFCPLCNATIVFDRRLDGKVLDFGTTGNLRKSDMVMYDRQTESWWQQFTGEAIVGDMLGSVLERVPAQIVAFEDLRAGWPAADVLSKDTGHRRNYGSNPYRGYDSIDDQPFLFSDPVDPRLPPMERVLNVSINGIHKLYPFKLFDVTPVINDVVGDLPVVVLSRQGTLSVLDAASIADARQIPSANAFARNIDDKTLTFEQSNETIVDKETGSSWNLFGRATAGPLKDRQLTAAPGGVHFAFAWLAFNPDSQIHTGDAPAAQN